MWILITMESLIISKPKLPMDISLQVEKMWIVTDWMMLTKKRQEAVEDLFQWTQTKTPSQITRI